MRGSSETPHCPQCERAFHDVERRVALGEDVSIAETVRAMIEDGTLTVVGVALDGSAIVQISADREAA